jgi:hypothetical protein
VDDHRLSFDDAAAFVSETAEVAGDFGRILQSKEAAKHTSPRWDQRSPIPGATGAAPTASASLSPRFLASDRALATMNVAILT